MLGEDADVKVVNEYQDAGAVCCPKTRSPLCSPVVFVYESAESVAADHGRAGRYTMDGAGWG